MPSTGTPSSKTPLSTVGAPGANTLAGPPDKMTAAGDSARSASSVIVQGWISQ
jgi:hypothetical protein